MRRPKSSATCDTDREWRSLTWTRRHVWCQRDTTISVPSPGRPLVRSRKQI
ncbi:hypothetical protein HSB1_17780 [Halogranum salarium B-1]|uniref:Uncharacterized protein n=1 Tax=Halogranum salarium B-1 TaxID=1210908 RepID=J2ZFZ7_9EURY|nr:hypothetical protein HSB1_17780 [Halogranum salarium B-1]